MRLTLDPPWRARAGTLAVRGTARVREAARIRLRGAGGAVGFGEALPLPGFSHDDAGIAEQVLAAIAAGGGLAVPAAPSLGAAALLDAVLAPYAALLASAPSARFALECALTDLLARRAGVSAAQWLADGRALQAVPISVLLPDEDGAVVAAAAAAAARGYSVLKLKIARADRSEANEDALLAALRAAIDAAWTDEGASPRLRLDANGALPTATVVSRLAQLARYGVELVEEPVAGAALLALPRLALAWAADESLADAALADALLALPPAQRPAAFVLKPAQLGLARCLGLAAAAAGRGIGVIVTHSFDGDLGYAAACALAAALPLAPWPCGLAPHAGLRMPLPAEPWLNVSSAPGLGVGFDGDAH